MIYKCKPMDEGKVFSYIGLDYPKCLYLYLDLKKYGIESDKIEVYIQYDNLSNITSVLLVYYSCLHVYSQKECFDANELWAFFCNMKCTMLYCTLSTAEIIYNAIPKVLPKEISFTTGWVAQICSVDKKAKGMAVPAQNDDFDQIARLIYSDEDIGRSYRYEELARQIKERNREGYARNYVIKQNDIVIAHACTNAEIDNIAVVAELLVKNEYRSKGFGSEIWRDICFRLLSEKKEVYSFYYTEESRRLHKHIGFIEVCEWAKIVVGG